MEEISIREFSTKMKEEGVDYKTIVINPSLLPKYADQERDILNFIREYADRIKWSQFMLKVWLEKYNHMREFRDHYGEEDI